MRLEGCKGFIPSAGFGSRLKPLTDKTPKPALPFFGLPAIYFVMQKLLNAGIADIAINTHFHAEQIQSLVSKFPGKAQFEISHEPKILGTGGGLVALDSWREDMNLMIYNPDIVCDVNIRDFYQFHQSSGAYASMVLLPFERLGTPPVLTRGDDILAFGAKHKIKITNEIKKCYGCAIYILSEKFLFDYLPKEKIFFSVIDCFDAALADKRPIKAYFHTGKWFDSGEHLFGYWQTHAELLKDFHSLSDTKWLDLNSLMTASKKDFFFSHFKHEKENPVVRKLAKYEGEVFISGYESGKISVAEGVVLGGRTCIFDSASIAKGAVVRNCLLMDGARVGAQEKLERMIITGEHRLSIQSPSQA